jgi:hypothetical protein
MSSLLVPAATTVLPAVAIAIPAATVEQTSRAETPWSHVFFDERFAEAQRLAQRLSGRNAPTPVQGDVTDLWARELEPVSRSSPLSMSGVTTESFYFCLKVLMSDRVPVDARATRIGTDLHFWTMHSRHHSQQGAISWQNHSRPA